MVGFRNNPVAGSSAIDWSYLNPKVVDYDSVAEVGDTNTVASMPSQGGDSDPSGPNTGYSYRPPLPPMIGNNPVNWKPQPLPDDYEYPQIPSILGTDYVANTMMYGNPKGPGNLNATQMSNIYKNVGDQQAYTLQSAKDFMNAGIHATPQQVHENAWLNQTGFDAQGNYHPEYDPNVGIHAAHMAAIPTYGAHSSGSAGGTTNTNSFFDANTMMGINNPAEGYQPSPFIEANQHLLTHGPVDESFLSGPLTGHDVTNTGQGFDYGGGGSSPTNLSTNDPGSGGKG